MENAFQREIIDQQKKRIEVMKSCREPYEVDVLGKKIIVLPKVFFPATDTLLLITSMKIQQDETVLEPCAGTGVISLFAAPNAKEIISTDINPYAVRNIERNAKQYGLQHKIKALRADLFPKIKKKFDVIIINPPYTDNESQNIMERAFWDENHQIIRKFFREVKKYLTQKGRIYLSWANFADFDFIEKLAKENHYTIKKIAETKKDNRIIFRVYEIHQE